MLKGLSSQCGARCGKEFTENAANVAFSAIIEFDLNCTVTYSPFSTPLLCVLKVSL